MSENSANTAQLRLWLERLRAGDASARDELLRSVGARLERLARHMLRGFPNVHRWVETDDVLQNALMRLLASLGRVEPSSMRDFYNFAATMLRRELLDLARHFARANRDGVLPLGWPGPEASAIPEPAAPADDPDDLDRWSRFHDAVEKLVAEERETVGLIFYHGWRQAEVAEQLGVNVRTVQRRWYAALLHLHDLLEERPPGT
jgi:RNA polymerase sigma factor (sigma-70 family)